MKLAVSNPNFSIIVPSACNAKCSFCFWEVKEKMPSRTDYLKKLKDTLDQLPSEFQQCSITGGEPTMCEYLSDILTLVRKRFGKVVLSSNGYDIKAEHLSKIDHLNVSRHHYIQADNIKVFGTKSVANDLELTCTCSAAEAYGVDVTLNCVLPAKFDDAQFIYQYLKFSKLIGAHGVCFRKEHSDLSPLPVETFFTQKAFNQTSCPVCSSHSKFIDGVKTTWRYSVREPSVALKGVYELVMQQDGRVTSDWAGNTEIEFGKKVTEVTKVAKASSYVGSGCGSSGCGGPVYKQSYSGCGRFGFSSCGR